MVTTQGTFESDTHDVATTRCTITITKEDIAAASQIFLETLPQNEFYFNLWSLIYLGSPASDRSFPPDKALVQLTETLPKEIIANFPYDTLPVDIYLDAKGNVVCIDGVFSPTPPDDPTFKIIYLHKTNEDGSILHTAGTPAGYQTDNDYGDLRLFYLENSDTKDLLALHFADFYTKAEISYAREKDYADDAAASDHTAITYDVTHGSNPTGTVLNIYNEATYDGADVKKNTRIDLYDLHNNEFYLVINAATSSAASDDAPMPKKADTVRLGAMTEDELNQWGAEAETQLTTGLQTIMMALPSSVLNTLMGQ